VTKRNKLVGIITATDLLRTFIDMMGILSSTSRIDVVIDDRPDAFKHVLQIISDNGGDIINAGMTRQEKKRVYYFRLSACETAVIQAALEKEKFEVLAALD
jgi:acetoin utilization protein AcuB